MSKDKEAKGNVVLLHGIFRSKFDMMLLENAFQKEGYNTLNIPYPSREKNLEDITDFVHTEITSHKEYSAQFPLHFVTHSMGGLIARYYIALYAPKNLGKVVMLGTPNKGSEFADLFSETQVLAPIYRSIFGPAGNQLTTTYEHIDTDVNYPLGVIAGDISINPLAPFVMNGAHDGIVAVDSTKIEGMDDHITLPACHSFMMFDGDVITQCLYFLENGVFNHAMKES